MGPVYMRVGRIASPILTGADPGFPDRESGCDPGGKQTWPSSAAECFWSRARCGPAALERGVSCRVINLHTVKPLDRETLVAAAEECGALVTVEEHSVLGGAGGAVAEPLSETKPVPRAVRNCRHVR